MPATIGTAYINVAPNMSGIQGKIASGLSGSGSAFSDQFAKEVSGKSAVIIGAISGVASAAAQRAMSLITSSIGAAVSRVDTLNSAQKTFQNMGFSATDAQTATSDLTKSILGLPTPLDSAMRGMTALAATYGDVKTGQKVFSGLNDAILGFGGTSDMVDGAIQQLGQLPMDGPLDAATWNSLRNNGLTPLLVAMGKDMGMSVNQLKDAFGSGKLTVSDFTNELEKLDTKGGGGLVSLQTIAQNSTSGIGTGFANMQTSITRGLADIIQAIGQKNISGAIASIGAGFEYVLKVVAVDIPIAVNAIKGFVGFIVQNKDIFGPIAAGVLAVVAAMTIWNVILGIWSAITTAASVVQGIFNLVLAANPIGLIILALIGLVAGLVYFFTQTELGKKIFASFGQAVSIVFDAIKSYLQIMVGSYIAAFNIIKSVFTGIYDIGKNMVQGLWSGINDMTGWIIGKIKGFGDTVLKSIKGFFGVHSQSTVFNGIGVNLNQGLANGLADSTGLVTGAVDDMANAALNSITSPLIGADVAYGANLAGGLAPAGTGGTNQTVTIGSIMLGDQSAVKEFFKKLNQDNLNIGMGMTPVQGAQ